MSWMASVPEHESANGAHQLASRRPRVLIVDPHEACRRAARALVGEAKPALTVVGEADHWWSSVAMISDLEADTVFLGLDGTEHPNVVGHLIASVPRVRVLVVSSRDGGDAIVEAMCQGASGFIPKSASPEDIIAALIRVARGEQAVHPQSTGDGLLRAVQQLRSRARGLNKVAGISGRELEVLQMLSEGLRPREIADRLVLSVRTVERHLAGAYRKLGVHSAIDAVNEYRRLQGALA